MLLKISVKSHIGSHISLALSSSVGVNLLSHPNACVNRRPSKCLNYQFSLTLPSSSAYNILIKVLQSVRAVCSLPPSAFTHLHIMHFHSLYSIQFWPQI